MVQIMKATANIWNTKLTLIPLLVTLCVCKNINYRFLELENDISTVVLIPSQMLITGGFRNVSDVINVI